MNVPKPILWIIWIGLLSFIVFYRVAYGAEMPEKEAVYSGLVILVSVLLVGSLVSRVLFLPKQENLLPFFVFGLAAAEAATFIGVILMPYYQDLVLAISAACMVTYVPLFIKAPNPINGSAES